MPSRMLGEYIGPGDSKYTEYDAAVVARTERWIGERVGQDIPWCLYVGLVAPHFPLVVSQEFYHLYPTDSLPPVKLHPADGNPRHPWVEKQNAFADTEAKFRDGDERLAAMAAYNGLCTALDHNIGRIVGALESAGLASDSTVIYTSDHGGNLGARGLWGKSNMYEESAAVPIIVARPGQEASIVETPVSLLDLSAAIPDHFGLSFVNDGPGLSLYRIAEQPTDPMRAVFSEYHAAGAVTGAFMLRRGSWKLIYYVGFEPELFDLSKDPEEPSNLAQNPAHQDVLAAMVAALREICDLEAVDAQALKDQADMIAGYGGRDSALKLCANAATPPPEIKPYSKRAPSEFAGLCSPLRSLIVFAELGGAHVYVDTRRYFYSWPRHAAPGMRPGDKVRRSLLF